MFANRYILFTVNLNFATVGTSMSQPLPEMVLAEVARLDAIYQSLNHRTRQKIMVEFRQDVFASLFMGRGRKDGLWFLLENEDFSELFP